MPVFADYALYYNLLYRDKDYAGETAFVLEILKKHGGAPRTLLDLGCGTGRHAVEMARQGVWATGVDMSETMLDMGRESINGLCRTDFSAPLPELLKGDARSVRLCRQFDAVVSLFHVMSYQNSEEDALSAMETAREHLKPGGLFFFDFWHGPGVLRDLPARRERILENDALRIRRVAEPDLRVNDNVVTVNYTVSICDLKNGQTTDLREAHSMRYWFLPELRFLSKQRGFALCESGEWMTAHALNINAWNGYICLRAM